MQDVFLSCSGRYAGWNGTGVHVQTQGTGQKIIRLKVLLVLEV